MIRTRITDLFGIENPIMLAGMNWITDASLVAAVSNAGGLGVLGASRFNPADLRAELRKIRELTARPFGVNQTLNLPRARENIEVAIEEKVPVINYALGKPWFVKDVHRYGGRVIGTTAVVKHAARAEELGCDAISITGHEAAAHGADATSLVLIPMVASTVKVPVLAAGGFYDGRGLAAALALGADGISMGTRFLATRESRVHEHYKQLLLHASEQDTLYSDRFDGMPGRVLKTRGAVAMARRKGFPLVNGLAGAMQVKKMLRLSWLGLFRAAFSRKTTEFGAAGSFTVLQQLRFAGGTLGQENAIYEGDEQVGFMFAGQCVGGIRDIPTVPELIDRIVSEAEAIIENAPAKYIVQRK